MALPVMFDDYSAARTPFTNSVYTDLRRRDASAFRGAARGNVAATAYQEQCRPPQPLCYRRLSTYSGLVPADMHEGLRLLYGTLRGVYSACSDSSECNCLRSRAVTRAALGWVRLCWIAAPTPVHPAPWGPSHQYLFALPYTRIRHALARVLPRSSSIDDDSPPTCIVSIAMRVSGAAFVERLCTAAASMSPYFAPCVLYIAKAYDARRFTERVVRGAYDISSVLGDEQLYTLIGRQRTARAAFGTVVARVISHPIASARRATQCGYICAAVLAYIEACDQIHREYATRAHIRTAARAVAQAGPQTVHTWDAYADYGQVRDAFIKALE